MRRALTAAALIGALAIVAAGSAVGHARLRDAEVSPLPAAANLGPRGLAAARQLLAATGRAVQVRAAGDPAPPPGAVVVLAAPAAPLGEADVAELLEHAAAGGTVVWAGGPPQPALARALGAAPAPAPGRRLAVPLAPHPLFRAVALPAGGGTVEVLRPGALPVAGGAGFASAVSVAVGRGEALVLAGPEPLENARIAEPGALEWWVRLAGRGPVVLDERFLAAGASPAPAAGRGLALVVAQGLLAAAVLVLARGRRLGAVRPPPPAASGRTTVDYLASLAALYGRTGSEPELAAGAWRAARRRLERAAGVPARAPDDEAARRLAARAPRAAEALARGAAALAAGGPGVLVAVTRAAAEAEAALLGRREPGRRPRSP